MNEKRTIVECPCGCQHKVLWDGKRLYHYSPYDNPQTELILEIDFRTGFIITHSNRFSYHPRYDNVLRKYSCKTLFIRTEG